MAKYDTQINLLERLIHNWYDIKTKEDFYKVFPEHYRDYLHRDGLCAVCRFGFMDRLERYHMFKEWSLYNRDLVYPVGGSEGDFGYNIDDLRNRVKKAKASVEAKEIISEKLDEDSVKKYSDQPKPSVEAKLEALKQELNKG